MNLFCIQLTYKYIAKSLLTFNFIKDFRMLALEVTFEVGGDFAGEGDTAMETDNSISVTLVSWMMDLHRFIMGMNRRTSWTDFARDVWAALSHTIYNQLS